MLPVSSLPVPAGVIGAECDVPLPKTWQLEDASAARPMAAIRTREAILPPIRCPGAFRPFLRERRAVLAPCALPSGPPNCHARAACGWLADARDRYRSPSHRR